MFRSFLLAMGLVVVCIGCHEGFKAYEPVSVNPHPAWTDWVTSHVTETIKNPAGCESCHGSTTDPSKSGGTSKVSCFSCHNHSTNAHCADCHPLQQGLWASANNLHAASVAEVLTNADHNTAEMLNDNCLKCHSPFQVSLGVAHFVTPVNQVGQPAGSWTALNAGDWQATQCGACHDPFSTNIDKLAKYGSVLDGTWKAGYTKISDLPAAYQTVIDATGVSSTFTYVDQTTLPVQATKLCSSCHDPADQGGDPNITVGGIDYGPQGGDSRSYVTTSHQGLGCIDCHPTHDFTPTAPEATPSCAGVACHSISRTGSLPGKVHINHL